MKINPKLAVAVLASLILLSFNCNNANAQLGIRVDGGVVDFKAVQLSPFATENFYTPAAQIGIDYDFYIKGKFYITPGLTWSYRPAKITASSFFDAESMNPNTYVSWFEWTHEHFLNLPVHFKWNFEIRPEKFSIFIFCGPVFSLGLVSQATINSYIRIQNLSFHVMGKYNYYTGANDLEFPSYTLTQEGEETLKKAVDDSYLRHARFQRRFDAGVGFRFANRYDIVLGSDFDINNRLVGNAGSNSTLQSSYYYIGFRYRFWEW